MQISLSCDAVAITTLQTAPMQTSLSFDALAITSLETLEFKSTCLLTLLQSQAWRLL